MECLERERILKQKEMEWVQLIRELEQFMAKLTTRAQPQTSPHSESEGKPVKRQAQLQRLQSPGSNNGKEPELEREIEPDFYDASFRKIVPIKDREWRMLKM